MIRNLIAAILILAGLFAIGSNSYGGTGVLNDYNPWPGVGNRRSRLCRSQGPGPQSLGGAEDIYVDDYGVCLFRGNCDYRTISYNEYVPIEGQG